MIKIIETEKIEKELAFIENIPECFKTQEHKLKIEIYKNVLKQTLPYTIIKHEEKKEIEDTEKINKVLNICLKEFDVTLNLVQNKHRFREIVEKRQVICVILRTIARAKLTTIGKIFNIHHATVIHHVTVGTNVIQTDGILNEVYYRIVKQCEEL